MNETSSRYKNIELQHVFSMFIKNNFKNKIKNIEAQIAKILRTPSLDRNFLVLINKYVCKKSCEAQLQANLLYEPVFGPPITKQLLLLQVQVSKS